MLKIVDVFSGAGGLTEGFRNKDTYDFVCHVEMDQNACSSLKLRNIYYYLKDTGNLSQYYRYIQGMISKDELYSQIPEDVTKDILNIEISKDTLPSIYKFIDNRLGEDRLDGIIGGPPCQAYSTIGRANNKSKKSTDKRIYLYKHYLNLLDRYNPKFFIFENVKGLLSFKEMSGDLLLPKIIDEFKECGYIVDYKIVDASEYGVPQKRERLILVGYKNDLVPNKTFFECLEKYNEFSVTIGELFNDLPPIKSGQTSNKYRCNTTNEYMEKYIRENGDFLTQHTSRPNNKNDLEIYKQVLKAKAKGKNLKYTDLPDNLQTHSNKHSFLDRFKALDYNAFSHTVVAHISKDGHYYIHPDINQNRSITVREAARIQGFPDNFYFENSRTAAFKQIGNAVPPILSKKIAMALLDFLNQ